MNLPDSVLLERFVPYQRRYPDARLLFTYTSNPPTVSYLKQGGWRVFKLSSGTFKLACRQIFEGSTIVDESYYLMELTGMP